MRWLCAKSLPSSPSLAPWTGAPCSRTFAYWVEHDLFPMLSPPVYTYLQETKKDGLRRVAHLGAGGVVSRPDLTRRLAASARVTVVSAPPGSGKSVLLRSWIGEAGLKDRTGWVSVGRDDRDPQRFWLSVLGALRQTSSGSRLVRELTAAPNGDGWAVVERLLKDLAPLRDRLWLVLDDVHELGSADALAQLELLLMRGPEELRFVLATRHDLRLGLHRLRLEGELTEIRAAHLRKQLVRHLRCLVRGDGDGIW